MQIMETNIGPEPICHGHEIVNKGNQNRTDFPVTLTRWGGIPSCFLGQINIPMKGAVLICIVILQLIVDLKGLLTMFSLCLMDLSYLILKETTADHRTVRTQHILETTHNDDEF